MKNRSIGTAPETVAFIQRYYDHLAAGHAPARVAYLHAERDTEAETGHRQFRSFESFKKALQRHNARLRRRRANAPRPTLSPALSGFHCRVCGAYNGPVRMK